MSAAVSDAATIVARVLGPEPLGLAQQAVVSLLTANGVSVEDGDGTGKAGRRVAVLVDPTDEDWVAAEAEGLAVVLVAGGDLGDGPVVDAVLRGAEAVVATDASLEALLHAVVVVAEGGTVLQPDQVRAVARVAREAKANPEIHLTRREAEIIESIANGDAVKQTARALGISAKTVENLQSRLFRKLGVQNRAQAVAQAHALGLL